LIPKDKVAHIEKIDQRFWNRNRLTSAAVENFSF